MGMLERLQITARWARPALPVSVVVSLAGVTLFLWSATAGGGGQEDGWLILGLLATLWGALLFTLITGFREVPGPAESRQRLVQRLKIRLARAGYVVMAWLMLGASAISLLMTYRLLALWLD
jgi:hypothetical protein